jgi:hypothetical protein
VSDQADMDAWQQQEESEREQRERAMLDRHVMAIAELHALMDEMGIRHAVPQKLQKRLARMA